VSYWIALNRRDNLLKRGDLRLVRRLEAAVGVYEVTCPPGAEAEQGADRQLEQAAQKKVVRWS
jgi:hypothetical protein